MIQYRTYRLWKNGPDFLAAFVLRHPVKRSWYLSVCMN